MGNSPKSLLQCIDKEGEFDEGLYALYRRAKRQKKIEDNGLLDNCANLAAEGMEFPPPSVRKQRACHWKVIDCMRDDAGILVEVTPKMSSWWYDYEECPLVEDAKFHRKFCLRFRCKYTSYLKIMTNLLHCDLFKRWLLVDCVGCEASPLELLVLGSFGTMDAVGCLRIWTRPHLQVKRRTIKCFH
jgi:hypothetical protein